ncbi:hypothetical protein [Methylobacterium sp. P1-11]|uniref:hypothetical protein n=1 Tax=Methylobacterium sp. P1-11 TaxID=2024616 RepID=UPI001FEF8DB0|nr:hypothetical protein [Methylobacterium sp. P1-11]
MRPRAGRRASTAAAPILPLVASCEAAAHPFTDAAGRTAALFGRVERVLAAVLTA